MSAIKSVIRELKDAVLKGMAHSKDRLHQVTDNVNTHLDDVVRQVRAQDTFTDAPALTGNSTNRVDRTSTEMLYRSDNRPPSAIFEEGFQVRDPSNNDLEGFVRTNGPSNFVSTTRDENLYRRWGSAYRYSVDAPGGIDVDATMPHGPYAPHTPNPESEVAFQGGIPAQNVVGAHPVLPGGDLGGWIPNPNYGGSR
ncbi:hypothetical protein ABC304_09140 [Microbacterium sp. 1P10UB]|uniref:scabin-related ADP-ribosyltransferase n=1 Tax=unclassified Microbacterium TaxID=2609290 RepID=UPI0039A3DC72